MFTCEILLATVLIVSPKDIDSNWVEVLQPALRTLAIDGELIDPREQIDVLKDRYEECKNHPHLNGQYFPDRKVISGFLATNRLYRDHLTKRLEIDSIHDNLIRDAIVETDQLYHVWETIREIQCDYYYVTIRRQQLKLLKDLMGDEIFYSGQLPPYLPMWHLPRK